ncbi:MAG: Fic family protein, partial [Bacilli bacterium]|nr:Fic family protein [Bacilli bacterium]
MLSQNLKKAAANNQELLAMRPLPKETLKSLREFYRVGLTYTSNALEGNSLTETETKVVIEDGLTINGKPLRDVYEAVGHAKAYDHIHELAKSKTLEESDILKLHQLFYQQIDMDNAGKYRTVPVFISGSHYAVTPHQKVAAEMKKFVAWFNKNEAKMNPVEFAALAHKKFVFIHPFVDGNGRMARLLMNLALLRGEYTIA